MRTDFFDYFGDRQHRYESRISLTSPLVIRFDGKECTANGIRDLTASGEHGFADSLIRAARELARRYKGIAYVDLDEVSLIAIDPKTVFYRVGSDKTQDIAAVLSQELFTMFNKEYTGYKPVYFSAVLFSIPNNKVVSYLKYRATACANTNRFYYSKKNHLDLHRNKIKGKELKKKLENLPDYQGQPTYAKEGVLIVNGKLCRVTDYIFGKYTPMDISTLDISKDETGSAPKMTLETKKLELSKDEVFNKSLPKEAELPNEKEILRIGNGFRAVPKEQIRVHPISPPHINTSPAESETTANSDSGNIDPLEF